MAAFPPPKLPPAVDMKPFLALFFNNVKYKCVEFTHYDPDKSRLATHRLDLCPHPDTCQAQAGVNKYNDHFLKLARERQQ